MEISHILVPTDFSPFSDLALEHAASLAEKFGAKITILHVITLAEVNALNSQPGNPCENIVLKIQNNMREEFEKNAGNYSIVEEPVLEVAVGEPAEEIAKFAEENGVNLIVMGTHGRTGLASIFLGSVTIGVIKKTCLPIMVVKCAESLK